MKRLLAVLVATAALAGARGAAASPADADKLRGEARAAMERKEYTEAANLLERAYQADPANAVLLKDLAVVLAADGKIDESAARYKQYLTAVPTDAAALLALATTLSWGKTLAQRDESDKLLTEYIEKHPDSDEALLQRARVRSWSGRTEGAEADFAAYLAKHPAAEDVRLELATTLSSKKDRSGLPRAIAIYDSHLAAHPDDHAILLQRARVYLWADRIPEATVDYRAYLAFEPADEIAVLELAGALAQGANPREAVVVYDRFLAKHPHAFDARVRRARTLLWAGEYGAAEAGLAEAASDATTSAERAEVLVERARLYAQTGRGYAALDLLDELLARDAALEAARVERDRIALLLGSRVESRIFAFGDKSGIRIYSATLAARAALGTSFAAIADVSGFSLGTSQETLLAARANLGAWARFRSLELEAAAGPRFYEVFSPRFGGRAAAKVTPASWANALLEYQYDDIYFDMLQPASVAAQIRGHALHLTGDVTLPKGIRVVGRVGTRYLVPDNKDLEATGTIMVPIHGPISVGYTTQYLTWDYNDPSYWSPQAFASHLGVVRLAQTFYRSGFGYDVQGVAGIAGERIEGVPEAGFGPSFGGSGAAVYSPIPWLELRLTAQYSQTVRELPVVLAGGSTPPPSGPVATSKAPSRYYWITTAASAIIYF